MHKGLEQVRIDSHACDNNLIIYMYCQLQVSGNTVIIMGCSGTFREH